MAVSPPAVAAAAAAHARGGSPTGVPGRSSTWPSAAVAAQPASTPTGSGRPSSSTDSESPKTMLRQGPYPRSLASAISGPRASAASRTARNSSSHTGTSSWAVISNMGTAIAFQPDSTVPSVAGMSLVTITCCSVSRSLLSSAFIPLSSRGTSAADRRADLRLLSVTAVPCVVAGAAAMWHAR
jgi:hypothetical protein